MLAVQVAGELAEKIREPGVQGITDLGAPTTAANDAARAQRLEVSGDRGLTDAEVLGEVACADIALGGQAPDDAQSRRVPQRSQYPGHVQIFVHPTKRIVIHLYRQYPT
jgi:hypothetical protein